MTDGRGWFGDEEGHRKAAKQGQQDRSVLGWVWHYLLMLVMLIPRGVGFLIRQARGTWRNTGRGWDYLTFDNILPPSITGTIQWFIETIPKLFGLRDTKPWEQFGAALSVIGVALLATVLTGGYLIATVLVVGGLGSFGLVRFVPAVNDKWTEWRAALPIKNDYDLARWERD